MTDTPVQRFLSALYRQTGEEAKPSGKGWVARCPAHEDRHPSLSIAQGDDGRALIRCHAGCTPEAICKALGLRLTDLMPDGTVDVDRNRKAPRKTAIVSTPRAGKTYPTARDAVTALDSFMQRTEDGRRVARWTYTDTHGEPVALDVRYDLPTPEGEKQRKTFRPVSRHADGWRCCDPPGKWPLYRLPELAGPKRAFVVEGEKCAEAARSIGLTATTSAHGSQSPDKTDWRPLGGKEVVILPDNDRAGRQYADTVAAILANLNPAPVVKLVTLPGLAEGGDIVNWINAHGDAAEPEELRRQVEALADAAGPIQPKRPGPRAEGFRPFPVDALPEPVRGFVAAGAKAIGCDPCYICVPLLSALASAIGATRRIELKPGWTEPSVIWTATVGESGTLKSPAMSLALHALQKLLTLPFSMYEHLNRKPGSP